MTTYKEPTLFGRDEDGQYEGRIEQIETGWFSGRDYDTLDISNRKPNLWILSLFVGYRQIGQFKVLKPHSFKEGQDVIVTKKDNKIIEVKHNG
jgi:hypothetical protein